MFKVYGEELEFVFTELRKKGIRCLIVDGKAVDLSEELELDETRIRHMEAVVDRFIIKRAHEKQIKAGILSTLLVGDGLMQLNPIGAGIDEAAVRIAVDHTIAGADITAAIAVMKMRRGEFAEIDFVALENVFH